MLTFSTKREGSLVYYTVDGFTDSGLVHHGFSTRLGGVSVGETESLNFGYGKKDTKENVDENYRIFAEALKIPVHEIVAPEQKHTANIGIVREEHRGTGLKNPLYFSHTDGLITDVPGIPLATYYADCIPVLLLDKKHQAIGAIHSGWRGTSQNIVGKGISAMIETYGSRREELLVAVGQSIGPCCFEVEMDAVAHFEGYEDYIKQKNEIKYHIDLWGIIAEQLKAEGVLAENTVFLRECTSCTVDHNFSHRKEKGKTGSMMALIMLK